MGVVFLAPGQRAEVIAGIENAGHTVKVLSSLKVDGEFGTPTGLPVKFELKEVPNDLVSSLRSSQRFSRQGIVLGENEGPSLFIMVGFPDFKWRFDKETGKRRYMLMADGWKETGVEYAEFQSRLLTFFMIGVAPIYVPTWADVGETIAGLYETFQRATHDSVLYRPNFAGHKTAQGWAKPTAADLILHIYQGFEGVGIQKGRDIWRTFGDFRTLSLAGKEHLIMVPGIGKTTANKINDQLDAKYEDYFDEKGNIRRTTFNASTW